MTVQHEPSGTGTAQSTAAFDSGMEQPHSAGTDAASQIKPEEVVFTLRAPPESGGYLVYSVTENPSSEDGKPFSLSVVHVLHLTEDSPLLKDLLLDQAAIPPTHLQAPRQVQVVVSTRSGLRLAPPVYEHVLRPLLAAVGLEPEAGSGNGTGYRVRVTTSPNTIRDLARDLGRTAHPEDHTIILLSGDGGVVDFLNGLDHASPTTPPPPPTIALLPLGTANALFHSLHKPHYTTSPHPSPLVLSLRTLLLKGTPRPLPTFRATFSPGAKLISAPSDPDPAAPHGDGTTTNPNSNDKDEDENTPHLIGAVVASYGFHATLVWASDTPTYRKHGAARFGMAAAELLKEAHVYEAGVDVRFASSPTGGGGGEDVEDGEEGWTRLRGEGKEHEEGGREGLSYVLATLVSNLEKEFAISPAGRPLDGNLRVVWFGGVGGGRTMQIMQAAYRGGEHVGMEEVGYREVEEVRVVVNEEEARWRKVCVDGSIVEVERGGWMKVKREEVEAGRVRGLL